MTAIALGRDVRAEMPNDLEPDYAAAVIDFHLQRYDHSLEMLKELQVKLPQSSEVLELRALNLRAMKQDANAAKVYKDLIDLKTKQGRPKKEIAPYAFELGMIRFGEKEYDRAASFFIYSDREGFNPELSRFYLGNIYFLQKKDDAAKKNFQAVADSELAELKPAAHFYLAQIYFRAERQTRALDRLQRARDSARSLIARDELPESSKSIARQIDTAVDTILKPIDQGQLFGSVAFLLGYDSNVLLLPNDGSDTASSGKSTGKASLSAALGYAGSSLDTNQFIPSIRLGTSRNSNNGTHSGEFLDTTVGLIYNREPLAYSGFGGRFEAGTLLQSEAQTAGSFRYGLFSKGAGIGPNYRRELGENGLGAIEYFARYAKLNIDDSLPDDQKRSGILHSVRASIADQRRRAVWNPTVTGKFDFSDTKGTEFQNKAYGLVLGNSHSVKEWALVESVDLTRSTYPDSAESRKDFTWTLGASASRRLSKKVQFLTTVDYSHNHSSQAELYAYHRFTFNVGLAFAL